MTERVSRSYLNKNKLNDFPVKDRYPGQFFEGPVDGTILREIPFSKMVETGQTPAKELEEVIYDHIIPFKKDLDLLKEEYGIRTVNPRYLIADREVADENNFYRTEKVLSIIADKIEGAIDFDDVLASGDETYLTAYDDLASRLVRFVDDHHRRGEVFETEIVRPSQYVIDPAAETIADATVLVDVQPHSATYRYPLDTASSALLNLAHEITQMAKVHGADKVKSYPEIMEVIASMPRIDNLVDQDVKDLVLEAMLSLDDQEISRLSVEMDDEYDEE